MKVLVTGATGFIGYHIAELLVRESREVRALVRPSGSLGELKKLGVELAYGDLRNAGSVSAAVRGCTQVYHAAADYRLWVPDPESMYAVNVGGTELVMQACRRAGVEKVVYTSSVGTLACCKSPPADELTPSDLAGMVGHYKRSKFMAEQRVREHAARGLPVVIVNPSTPVGPLDRKPTPSGKVIVDFLRGKMPAYLDTGLNFIDVGDVARGHLLAAARGRPGERYILGNRNLTLREFFTLLAGVSGRRAPRVRLPYAPVLMAACVSEALCRWVLRGTSPRVPLAGVRMARRYMFFDASKACRELELPQTPLEESLGRAVSWFREHAYAPRT